MVSFTRRHVVLRIWLIYVWFWFGGFRATKRLYHILGSVMWLSCKSTWLLCLINPKSFLWVCGIRSSAVVTPRHLTISSKLYLEGWVHLDVPSSISTWKYVCFILIDRFRLFFTPYFNSIESVLISRFHTFLLQNDKDICLNNRGNVVKIVEAVNEVVFITY